MNRPELWNYRNPESGGEVAVYFNYAYDLEKYCNELERALDKVCDLLVGNNNNYKCNIKSLDDEGYVIDHEFTRTKEEWKEWALKMDKFEKALEKMCKLMENQEKDSCYYCPVGPDNCVDPEAKHVGDCSAKKWKEWALKDE